MERQRVKMDWYSQIGSSPSERKDTRGPTPDSRRWCQPGNEHRAGTARRPCHV